MRVELAHYADLNQVRTHPNKGTLIPPANNPIGFTFGLQFLTPPSELRHDCVEKYKGRFPPFFLFLSPIPQQILQHASPSKDAF
jgi:hypothetical protein